MNTQEVWTAKDDKRSKGGKFALFNGWKIWDILLLVAIVSALVGLGVWAGSPWYVILGASLNVIGGFFNVKTSKLYFVFSIGYSACYFYVAYANRLYGEMITTVLLVLLATLAIVRWLRADDVKRSTYEMRSLEPLSLVPMAVVGVAAFLAYGFVLRHLGSRLPFLSAGTAVVSVCAFILTGRRVRLQWALWLLNNAVYVSIWVITIAEAGARGESDNLAELPLVAQSLLYVAINVYGLISWNKEWAKRVKPHEPPLGSWDETCPNRK